jgi:hypothetical protein
MLRASHSRLWALAALLFQVVLASADPLPASAPSVLDEHGLPTMIRIVTPPLDRALDVSPGQRFYSDVYLKKARAYEVTVPFESRTGALQVRFAIDAAVLEYRGTSENGEWDYYVPPAGKYRAWNTGSKDSLAPGDVVGLRASKSGRMEWFVDNRNFTRSHIVWSRPVGENDPVHIITGPRNALSGMPLRQLYYLGVRGGAVAIRYRELSAGQDERIDEFSFPVDSSGRAICLVMGAEFEVRPAPSQRAEILVTKAIESESATGT